MPGDVRFEPIVALTDAPTVDENLAIDSGLARFNEQQSGQGRSRQAPDFYERQGYQVLGIVPCLPPGTSRIFMMKPLA